MTRCASGQMVILPKNALCPLPSYPKSPAHSKLFRVARPSASSLTAMVKSSGKRRRRLGRTSPPLTIRKPNWRQKRMHASAPQNGAYDKWHGICGEKAILFDWDQFVAVASKEISNLSLPSEDDTTPELVAEKSRRWHQWKDAISHQKAWVKSHINDLR